MMSDPAHLVRGDDGGTPEVLDDVSPLDQHLTLLE